MLASVRVAAAFLALGQLCVACAEPDVVLLVDLKTDMLPGRQFVGIRTEYGSGDFPTEGSASDTVNAFATMGEDYLSGRRIAEFSSVPKGALTVRVTLLDTTGAVVVARNSIVQVEGNSALTVLITGSCREVSCPGPGDDPAQTSCVGARCVDPRCSPETPEFCGEPGCTSDSGCPPVVECGRGLCLNGECFVRLDDSACAASEICDPGSGCIRRPDLTDAGPSCPSTETACSDGADDDCDGDVDCADMDCRGASCDDANTCTTGDQCNSAGVCRGTGMDCDDGNPCTDDGCAMGACTHANNTAPCDDGLWCNGTDACSGGTCSSHTMAPCAAFCNESTRTCEACRSDPDCGTVTHGTWGACEGFSDTCDESGTESRTVTTPRCTMGMCTTEPSMETRGCSRSTTGTMCAATGYGGWGACGGFSNACDTTGTRSRSVTTHACAGGACAPSTGSQSQGCSRTVADGTSCGGTWDRCCGGACVNLTTNARCGACNVSCSAIGRTCGATGTGGYSCRGCTGNAECISILNGAATCWNVAAPPAFCQCQCSADGVCANGGCGAGMYCHDCPGHNFCAPFGGTC